MTEDTIKAKAVPQQSNTLAGVATALGAAVGAVM